MSTDNKDLTLVPALRFIEFEGEWEPKKLEDLAKIKYGKDQKQVVCDNGRYPILGTGGEMGRTNEFLYDKPSVLIGRKGTIDKPKYMDTPFWTVDTLFYTEVLLITFPKWLFYRFETINWYLYNEASGVPSLSGSTIYKIPISLPTLPEQTRIASFFTVLDQKLTQLKQKKNLLTQYKKGVMRQLFSQKLRFKDDDGNEFPDWVGKKLGGIIDSLQSGKDKPDNQGDFTVFGSMGIIGKSSTYSYNNKNILIARVGANAGSMNIVEGKYGVSDNTLVLITNHNHNLIFIYYLLVNENLNKLVFGSGQPLITSGQLKLLVLNIPCLEEQTKIANFLSVIDEKINQTQTQIKKTEQYKKGLLQKMFC